MMITQDVYDALVKLVYDDLNSRFKGEVEFDPIDIVEEIDEYGDPYLHIRIVCDGDPYKIDSQWCSRLIARLLPELVDLGIKHVPSRSFFGKEGWETYKEKSRRWNQMI